MAKQKYNFSLLNLWLKKINVKDALESVDQSVEQHGENPKENPDAENIEDEKIVFFLIAQK